MEQLSRVTGTVFRRDTMREQVDYSITNANVGDGAIIQGNNNQIIKIGQLIIQAFKEEDQLKKNKEFLIPRISYINCDRTAIMARYLSYFNDKFETSPPPYYFFAIPSSQSQQAPSLIERMTLSLIDKNNRQRKVHYPVGAYNQFKISDLPVGENEIDCQYRFREEFARMLQIKFNESGVTTSDFTLEDLGSCSYPLSDHDIIAVPFRVQVTDLNKTYVLNYLQWILREFCSRKKNAPFFIFFLELQFPKRRPSFFSKNPFGLLFDEHARALQKIESLKAYSEHFVLFPPLKSIPLDELDRWLSEHITNERKRNNLIKKLIQSLRDEIAPESYQQENLSMADAEIIIERILKQLQEEINPL